MKDRSRRNRFEEMDRDLLTKLFLCYIQWCIGELPDEDRVELEQMTPSLQVQFGCSGPWYEVFEERFELPASGREILRGFWQEMRAEVSAKDFVTEFATGFIEKVNRMNKKATRSTFGRGRRGH